MFFPDLNIGTTVRCREFAVPEVLLSDNATLTIIGKWLRKMTIS